tara:strand:- start:235 stop:957 length:723 start_codon:yes stop_codon:yes gene_type:complete
MKKYIKKFRKYKLLIVLIIIGIILLYIYFIRKKYSLSNINKIAVIGNGPLSDEDINEINSNFKIIVGMNGVANGRKDTKVKYTQIFSRQWEDTTTPETINFIGYDKDKKILNSYEKYKDTIKDILLVVPKGLEYKEGINDIKNKYKNVSIHSIDANLNDKKNKGPNKYKFNGKNYDIYHSLSMGIISIGYILDKYPDHDIHIYGMNFAQRGHHDGIVEKKMVKKCYRCKIHKTFKNTYEP